ncbi:hypothetical protein D5086_031577 [Populus alba]|uniref:Uncharacterized protein n=1 Tax=Populus alba TaxID=43335 RepID=A0ACC4AIZ2_POPAL
MLVTTKNQGISLKFNTNYIDLNFGPYIEERKRYIQKRKRTAVPPDLRPEHRRPHEDDRGIDESEIEVKFLPLVFEEWEETRGSLFSSIVM